MSGMAIGVILMIFLFCVYPREEDLRDEEEENPWEWRWPR